MIVPVICSRVIVDKPGLFLLGKKLALMEMRIMSILLLLSFELKGVPDPRGGYDAIEGVTVTRQPRKCFVKLGLRNQRKEDTTARGGCVCGPYIEKLME